VSKSNLCHVWMTNNLQWGIEHWHLSNSAVVPFLWLRRQDSLHWHRRWYWQWHSYLPEVDFEPDSLRQLTVLFWLDGMRWATKHITIMARASPLIVTVPTPWNVLINDMACSRGCVSEVDWQTFCCNRRRVKNLPQETHPRGECLFFVVMPLTAVQFVETAPFQVKVTRLVKGGGHGRLKRSQTQEDSASVMWQRESGRMEVNTYGLSWSKDGTNSTPYHSFMS